ncbi:lysophosphatidylserine lipase ABHD12-like isoform X2 [Parasteatoda tepidariorum]
MLESPFFMMGQAFSKRLLDADIFSHKRNWRIFSQPWVVRTLFTLLFVFYLGVPAWFYFCPWFRRTAVYLHFADWPFQALSDPEKYGLSNTKHFFVETSTGELLGVWHILPNSANFTLNVPSSFDNDDQPVILYLHGSAESRSAPYRRSMYGVLTRNPLCAHVVTFDYRGFGDSTYISPTASTLQEDAMAMFLWLQKYVDASRIIIWGHSMGTGIAVKLGEALSKSNQSNPFAIVLEAPFTSIADATRTFPLSYFHRRLPLFETFCAQQTRHPDTNLNSDERIGAVTAPILILHAADDSMVWSEQGKTLWKRAIRDRPSNLHRPVFVELDGKHGCGHRNIHKAPNLSSEVFKFLESVKLYNIAQNSCQRILKCDINEDYR